MKSEWAGKIMTAFEAFRAYTYSFLTDHDYENKKAKGTRKHIINRRLEFENCKSCLDATKLENKINHQTIN